MSEWVNWEDIERSLSIDEKKAAKYRKTLLAAIDGVKLSELRKVNRLTQAQMAKRLKIDQSNVSRIERGKFDTIEIRTLQKYVEALGGELEIRVKIDEVSQRLIDSEYERKLAGRLARDEKSSPKVKKKRKSPVKGKTPPRAKSVAHRRKGRTQTAPVGAAKNRAR